MANVQAIQAKYQIGIDISAFLSIFVAVMSFPFVYICTVLFWNKLINIISDTGVLKNSPPRPVEIIAYTVLLLAFFVLVTISFTRTNAFYGTEQKYNIIYTSDSPELVKSDVYIVLNNSQNDIRQPLFAVFSAPFLGIVYLISNVFSTSATVNALLLDYVQIMMLFFANYILTKTMRLTSVKRLCFMLMSSCTYTYLLSILMIEQFIVAYFWLMLCVYLICERKHPDRIALWGAGGTLVTSMILLPYMSDKSPLRDIKGWFKDMVKYGLEFIVFILAFCRFDIIVGSVSSIAFLSKFMGATVKFADKIRQYTIFVRNCFLAPNAGAIFPPNEYASWRLNAATGISVAGIAILLLAILSAVLNRDKKSSLIAAGWIGFSVVILIGFGWGTAENGLILYSLYFFWAFIMLLFQLVEKIESKLNVSFLIPVISVVCAAVFIAINMPAIVEMLHFAITNYPV